MKTGRKIAVFLVVAWKNAIVNGERLGYIKVPKGTFVDAAELNQLPTNETMIFMYWLSRRTYGRA